MRVVQIESGRVGRWLAGFAARHGDVSYLGGSDLVVASAADGAVAELELPFPPLPSGELPGSLFDHLARPRTVGALLVRRGGVAVGVFAGRRLLVSKIETHYVQGRTKAGGWSQQRFARRRDNQARGLTDAAAELAASLLLPRLGQLDALVTGGDAASVATVLGERRLAELAALVTGPCHPVPDPRLAVLQAFPDQFYAVRIRLNDLA